MWQRGTRSVHYAPGAFVPREFRRVRICGMVEVRRGKDRTAHARPLLLRGACARRGDRVHGVVGVASERRRVENPPAILGHAWATMVARAAERMYMNLATAIAEDVSRSRW